MNTGEVSSNFNQNNYVSVGSECQCCSYLRSEVCYLVNELKSMTEIINILNKEVKYYRTVNHDQRMYSECVKEPTVIYSQRENCSNLENQPKLVGNLNLVKRTTTGSLAQETKLVKQTLQAASNIYNPWPTACSSGTYRQHSIRSPAREPLTYGTCGNSTTYQYSVPIANQYTTLSNCQELQPTCEMISPSNDKYPPRFMAAKNHKYITRSPKENK